MATTSHTRHHHAVFRARMMHLPRLPAPGDEPVPLDCPRCATQGALADRVSATIYGWHDGVGQCGWVDTLTVGQDQHGALTLT